MRTCWVPRASKREMRSRDPKELADEEGWGREFPAEGTACAKRGGKRMQGALAGFGGLWQEIRWGSEKEK